MFLGKQSRSIIRTDMAVDPTGHFARRQVRNVQLHFIPVIEMENILLFPDTAQDAQISELGIKSVASVPFHSSLQVLFKFAM